MHGALQDFHATRRGVVYVVGNNAAVCDYALTYPTSANSASTFIDFRLIPSIFEGSSIFKRAPKKQEYTLLTSQKIPPFQYVLTDMVNLA